MANKIKIRLDELYIFENILQKKWEWNNNIWWKDPEMLFYHGTHINNLKDIEKNGLIAGPGSKGVGVYLALDPFTARGYAAMSAAAGEKSFKKQKNPKYAPMEDRAVLIIKIPQNEIESLFISKNDSRLTDYSSWEKEGKGNPKYWEFAEVVYPKDLPASYIIGFMKKV